MEGASQCFVRFVVIWMAVEWHLFCSAHATTPAVYTEWPEEEETHGWQLPRNSTMLIASKTRAI